MIYRQFHIGRFRGVANVTVSLVKGDLALLVGLNESGKTTILKGIEAFDHRNDPPADEFDKFLSSIRNKSDPFSSEPASVTAEIELERELKPAEFRTVFRKHRVDSRINSMFEDFLDKVNDAGKVVVTRVFPFEEGEPRTPFYKFESDHALTSTTQVASWLVERLVEICPFILYFEDFTDRIPERIYVAHQNPAYSPDWYDIIDGLFYHTDPRLSISTFTPLFGPSTKRPDDAKTIMRRVNKTLNEVFTKKWEKLSGVSDIQDTELIAQFPSKRKYFEIKVSDTDGTTYSVDERSKGALWYLSFLMKTEFRRKKMRKDSGKPIFLIDEPASNLHSTAQQNMLQDFNKLVEDTSVIYTTHSQYLISLENVKNTYVIRRSSGVVSATVWAEYIREDAPLVTHYQPLANLLELTPFNLDVAWATALVTEGVSDAHTLRTIYRALHGRDPDFVIYPGTNAFNLGTLITLNIGWQADFRVLLDSDDAGLEAQERYMSEFGLSDQICLVLPEKKKKIEGYFTDGEKEKLYEMAFGTPKNSNVTKKEFRAMMAVLSGTADIEQDVMAALGSTTAKRFRSLFARIGL